MPMLWVHDHFKYLLLQHWDRIQTAESDVYRRQILTSKFNLRAVKVHTIGSLVLVLVEGIHYDRQSAPKNLPWYGISNRLI